MLSLISSLTTIDVYAFKQFNISKCFLHHMIDYLLDAGSVCGSWASCLMQLHLPQSVPLHDTVASCQDHTNCCFQFTFIVYLSYNTQQLNSEI